jgi:hypothetical protein
MENEKTLEILVLITGEKIISQIEEVYSDLGKPDCKLINPFLINSDNLSPWFEEYTDDEEIMISSDKILTILEPKQTFLDKYLELTQ